AGSKAAGSKAAGSKAAGSKAAGTNTAGRQSAGHIRRRVGQHHGELRPALMASALAFLERGEADFSLRALARASDVSPAAVYHHFADKDSLLAAVAGEGFAALGRELDRMGPARDAAAQLRRMVTAYVRFAAAHGAHYQVMFSPALKAERHPELDEVARAAFARLAQAVGAVGGSIPPREVKARAAAVWALAHGAAQLAQSGALAALEVERGFAPRVGRDAVRIATEASIEL
ncbi:MAG: TetR/AcrR family transcriptional regulator, partial [Myxococcota bacterium]